MGNNFVIEIKNLKKEPQSNVRTKQNMTTSHADNAENHVLNLYLMSEQNRDANFPITQEGFQKGVIPESRRHLTN